MSDGYNIKVSKNVNSNKPVNNNETVNINAKVDEKTFGNRIIDNETPVNQRDRIRHSPSLKGELSENYLFYIIF